MLSIIKFVPALQNILYHKRTQNSGSVKVSYNIIKQHNRRLANKTTLEENQEGCESRQIVDVDAVINGFKESCALLDE